MDEAVLRNPDGTYPKGSSGNKKGTRKPPKLPDQQIIPGNLDGFMSATTGIGTRGFDKRLSHIHVPACLSYQDAISLWATSDMARRAIQDPIEDAFRQGWELEIKDEGDFEELKEAVATKLLDLKVDAVVSRKKKPKPS